MTEKKEGTTLVVEETPTQTPMHENCKSNEHHSESQSTINKKMIEKKSVHGEDTTSGDGGCSGGGGGDNDDASVIISGAQKKRKAQEDLLGQCSSSEEKEEKSCSPLVPSELKSTPLPSQPPHVQKSSVVSQVSAATGDIPSQPCSIKQSPNSESESAMPIVNLSKLKTEVSTATGIGDIDHLMKHEEAEIIPPPKEEELKSATTMTTTTPSGSLHPSEGSTNSKPVLENQPKETEIPSSLELKPSLQERTTTIIATASSTIKTPKVSLEQPADEVSPSIPQIKSITTKEPQGFTPSSTEKESMSLLEATAALYEEEHHDPPTNNTSNDRTTSQKTALPTPTSSSTLQITTTEQQQQHDSNHDDTTFMSDDNNTISTALTQNFNNRKKSFDSRKLSFDISLYSHQSNIPNRKSSFDADHLMRHFSGGGSNRKSSFDMSLSSHHLDDTMVHHDDALAVAEELLLKEQHGDSGEIDPDDNVTNHIIGQGEHTDTSEILLNHVNPHQQHHHHGSTNHDSDDDLSSAASTLEQIRTRSRSGSLTSQYGIAFKRERGMSLSSTTSSTFQNLTQTYIKQDQDVPSAAITTDNLKRSSSSLSIQRSSSSTTLPTSANISSKTPTSSSVQPTTQMYLNTAALDHLDALGKQHQNLALKQPSSSSIPSNHNQTNQQHIQDDGSKSSGTSNLTHNDHKMLMDALYSSKATRDRAESWGGMSDLSHAALMMANALDTSGGSIIGSAGIGGVGAVGGGVDDNSGSGIAGHSTPTMGGMRSSSPMGDMGILSPRSQNIDDLLISGGATAHSMEGGSGNGGVGNAIDTLENLIKPSANKDVPGKISVPDVDESMFRDRFDSISSGSNAVHNNRERFDSTSTSSRKDSFAAPGSVGSLAEASIGIPRERLDSFLGSFSLTRDRLDSVGTFGTIQRERLGSLASLSDVLRSGNSGNSDNGRERLDSLASLGECSMSITDLADVAGALEAVVGSGVDSDSSTASMAKKKPSASKSTSSLPPPTIQVDSDAVQAAVQAAMAATSGLDFMNMGNGKDSKAKGSAKTKPTGANRTGKIKPMAAPSSSSIMPATPSKITSLTAPIPAPPMSKEKMDAIRARARAAAGYVPPVNGVVPKATPPVKRRNTSTATPAAKRARASPALSTPSSKAATGVHLYSDFTPKRANLRSPAATPSSTNSKGQSNQKWEEMFQCLVEYVKEQKEKAFKTLSEEEKAKWEWAGNVPTMYKTKTNKALGRWINNQRSAKSKGNLKREREIRLVGTGLKWSVLTTNAWTDMMDELRAYVREKTKDGKVWDGNVPTNYKIKNNTAPDGSEIDDDKNLGRWINRQRSLYSAGKLKKERQIELEKIGLKWAVLSTTTWGTMYESLCKYVQSRRDADPDSKWDGNVPANHETMDKPPKRLGRWVNRQRSAYANNKLKKEFANKLERIGLKWTAHDKKLTDVGDELNDEINDDDALRRPGSVLITSKANAVPIRVASASNAKVPAVPIRVTSALNAKAPAVPIRVTPTPTQGTNVIGKLAPTMPSATLPHSKLPAQIPVKPQIGQTVTVPVKLPAKGLTSTKPQVGQTIAVPVRLPMKPPVKAQVVASARVPAKPQVGQTVAVPVRLPVNSTVKTPGTVPGKPQNGQTTTAPVRLPVNSTVKTSGIVTAKLKPQIGQTARVPVKLPVNSTVKTAGTVPTKHPMKQQVGKTATIPFKHQVQRPVQTPGTVPARLPVKPQVGQTATAPVRVTVNSTATTSGVVPAKLKPQVGQTATAPVRVTANSTVKAPGTIPTGLPVKPQVGQTATVPVRVPVNSTMKAPGTVPTRLPAKPQVGQTATVPVRVPVNSTVKAPGTVPTRLPAKLQVGQTATVPVRAPVNSTVKTLPAKPQVGQTATVPIKHQVKAAPIKTPGTMPAKLPVKPQVGQTATVPIKYQVKAPIKTQVTVPTRLSAKPQVGQTTALPIKHQVKATPIKTPGTMPATNPTKSQVGQTTAVPIKHQVKATLIKTPGTVPAKLPTNIPVKTPAKSSTPNTLLICRTVPNGIITTKTTNNSSTTTIVTSAPTVASIATPVKPTVSTTIKAKNAPAIAKNPSQPPTQTTKTTTKAPSTSSSTMLPVPVPR